MIEWLIGTLVATSLLALFVLLVRVPVRARFGARVAYGLWLLPVARLFMPPLIQTVELPAAQPSPLRFSSAIGEPLLMQTVVPASSLPLGGDWQGLLVPAWLAVAAALFLAHTLAFRRERLSVLAGAEEMGRDGSIRVVRSPGVQGPMAFGIFDRVIAVPVDFERRFDPLERRLVLDHELAHHRHGDLAVNVFALLLLCLMWFNPIAWIAYRAFRFDQEAACDARVLDRSDSALRASYGRVIAKAASGQAHLFASALGRKSTLSKRLRSMLANPTSGRRVAGKLLIAASAAVALPATATRTTDYVPVPRSPQAARPAIPVALAQPASLVASSATVEAPAARLNRDGSVTLPGGVTLGKGDIAFLADDSIIIRGKVKRMDQLTRAERSELRATLVRGRRELALEQAKLPSRLAEMRQEIERLRSGEVKRELLQARADFRRDLAEIESIAAELRADGEDPEQRKAEIRAALREIEAQDIDRMVREQLAEIDPDRIVAELREALQQNARMQARLQMLERTRND